MPRIVCDLARFTAGFQNSGPFVAELWCWFSVSTTIVAYLDTFTQHRLLRACLVLQVDRTDVALGSTEVRLRINLDSWSVQTPPVQAFVPPVQTVWDGFTDSDDAGSN